MLVTTTTTTPMAANSTAVPTNNMTSSSSTDIEALAAQRLLDPNDPGLLTAQDVKYGWGSWTAFLESYALNPANDADVEEALRLSRMLKGASEADRMGIRDTLKAKLKEKLHRSDSKKKTTN